MPFSLYMRLLNIDRMDFILSSLYCSLPGGVDTSKQSFSDASHASYANGMPSSAVQVCV